MSTKENPGHDRRPATKLKARQRTVSNAGDRPGMAPTKDRGRTGGLSLLELASNTSGVTAAVRLRTMLGSRSDLPHRESFGPDAAWDTGPDTGMEFCDGAPVFAVEVRSKEDYGPAAERAMKDKRADYFACGTLVVWDVDLQSEDVVKSYKASDPDNPVIFRRGETADAEPAVPGWRMVVDELFS